MSGPAEKPSPITLAHLDEGAGPLPSGGRLYGIAAMVSTDLDEQALRADLRAMLLQGQTHLHHRTETKKRRIEIAYAIAGLPISGALVVTGVTTNTHQERARAGLLRWLLPRLQHVEQVDQVIIESRHGSDVHDRRTIRRLRQSFQITPDLRAGHIRKLQEERLWLADFVVGAYCAAQLHDEPEPWEIITAAHVIDVTTDPR